RQGLRLWMAGTSPAKTALTGLLNKRAARPQGRRDLGNGRETATWPDRLRRLRAADGEASVALVRHCRLRPGGERRRGAGAADVAGRGCGLSDGGVGCAGRGVG